MADILIKNATIVTMSGASDTPKCGEALQALEVIQGSIAIEEGKIIAVGEFDGTAKKAIDAAGKIVLPGFIDCHTHLVYAGSRHFEYEAKCWGEGYVEHHKPGGGIYYTVDQTRAASKEALLAKGLKDLDLMLEHGTTTVEIKSGYGLDEANEFKILEVIAELNKKHPMTIVPTFLGAHTVPKEFLKQREAYVQKVIDMLPRAAKYAEFCDIFCDELGFDEKESEQILTAAKNVGMKLKVHADQTSNMGASVLAGKLGATSAEHLDYVDEDGMAAMKKAGTVAVLLPGVTYHLTELTLSHAHNKAFLPKTVRTLIQQGLPIALATDYNPGSCPCLSMKTICECAARIYRMKYAEILNAATINAAHAVCCADARGSIEVGKCADLVIHDCSEYGMLIDSFGVNLVDTVIKDGAIVVQNGKRV